MKERVKIVLKSGKDESVMRYHPWIFSGAIKKIYGNPAEGDIVDVYDNKDNFLARGHYAPGSIAIRVLTFENVETDIDFIKTRIENAVQYRNAVGVSADPGTNVYRLIHGEGDGLPGLIVDFYNGVAVLQFHSLGFYRIRKEICSIIVDILKDQVLAVYDKSEGTMPRMADVTVGNEFLYGSSGPVTVTENGYKFLIDWTTGQKTGFFIDQKDNRKLLESYTRGRKVLNMFAYTGGFSVYAMKNAELVHTVDSSAGAIDMANENIRINYGDDKRHTSFKTDAFGFLEDIRDKYDLIILDPPAFAKHNNVLSNALQGYKRLNIKAIEQIRPGRDNLYILMFAGCIKGEFSEISFAAAANTGRRVRILHQMSQPPDHPVNIYHPESEYLKGLVIYVD